MFAGLFGASAPGARSTASGANAASGGAPTYTFARLQYLYERLSHFRESDLEKGGGGDAIVETVRQITEAVIWGEQNDARFFDFFCEKNILADFVGVLGLEKAPTSVKVQLLQTLAMLVLNIRCQTSVYYLLSNNHINNLIKTTLDFEDEEVLAYYITFMKSLAMRLDQETINFFFVQYPQPTFPLYIEATKFFDNRDQMVRTTVRTITLQVYRMDDPLMRRFVLRHAAESYFSQLAFHLRDLWLRLDAAACGVQDKQDLLPVQREHELQKDLLVYLSDVFDLGVEELNEVLADRLLNCAMLPLLLTSLVSLESSSAPSNEQARVLAPSVACFLMRQVFDTFRIPCLLEPLASALLNPSIPAALAYVLPQPDGYETSLQSEHAHLPNWLRQHFLSCLQKVDDFVFLLSAAMVHGCLSHGEKILQLLGRRHEGAAVHLELDGEGTNACGAHATSALATGQLDRSQHSSTSGEVCTIPSCDLDLHRLLLAGLARHQTMRPEALWLFVRLILDLFLSPDILPNATFLSEVANALFLAAQSTAWCFQEQVEEQIQGGSCADVLVDAFFEEWAWHQESPPDVGKFFSDPWRLLPGRLWWQPSSKGLGGVARDVVRKFLLLRRALADVKAYQKEAQGHGAEPSRRVFGSVWVCDEPLPVSVEAPGHYREGASFDFGLVDRIVCGVASPKGKCTRYLLLHRFWFMLVQPDIAAPGWATVRTLWPIWQVQALADRSDPRTLQIFMNPAARSLHREGSKSRDGTTATEHNIVLNFEDVRRCHAANEHIQQRRSSIRIELLQKLVAFIQQDCEHMLHQQSLD